MSGYRCPDCGLVKAVWGDLRKHIESSGHAPNITRKRGEFSIAHTIAKKAAADAKKKNKKKNDATNKAEGWQLEAVAFWRARALSYPNGLRVSEIRENMRDNIMKLPSGVSKTKYLEVVRGALSADPGLRYEDGVFKTVQSPQLSSKELAEDSDGINRASLDRKRGGKTALRNLSSSAMPVPDDVFATTYEQLTAYAHHHVSAEAVSSDEDSSSDEASSHIASESDWNGDADCLRSVASASGQIHDDDSSEAIIATSANKESGDAFKEEVSPPLTANSGATPLDTAAAAAVGSDDDSAALASYFAGATKLDSAGSLDRGISVSNKEGSDRMFRESALLGLVNKRHAVYLNTHEPFCFITVGVQGAGKSHTLACSLEGCLVPFKKEGVVRLDAPMTTLVLHYDTSAASVCEATGLVSPAPELQRLFGSFGAGSAPSVPKDRAVVLVSPSYLVQRRKFYGSYCTVQPLLLSWATLTADHIKRIMRIKDGDNQLYVAALLDLLRRYQRLGVVPNFQEFMEEVREVCNCKGQEGPLGQRLALLESLVAESALNASLLGEGADLGKSCKPGHLVVVDMTDPLLSSEEANGIFQVLVEQFRALPTRGGKVLALDEAHKYMQGIASDGLSAALVSTARLMRHDGMRLLVSTQSPLALAPELLELVSVAFLHRFHSTDWFSYLSKKLPLDPAAFKALVELQPGTALMFASRHTLPLSWGISGISGCPEELGDWEDGQWNASSHPPLFKVAVRQRITADRGASRTNIASIR